MAQGNVRIVNNRPCWWDGRVRTVSAVRYLPHPDGGRFRIEKLSCGHEKVCDSGRIVLWSLNRVCFECPEPQNDL